MEKLSKVEILQRQNKRLFILNDAADAIHRAATEEAVYQTVAERIAKLGYYGGLLMFDDVERERIRVKGLVVPPELEFFVENMSTDIIIPLRPEALFGKAETFSTPIFIKNNRTYGLKTLQAIQFPDPEFALNLAGKAIIRAPLIVQKNVVGMLVILGRAISPEDIPLVSTLANHVSTAIEKIRLVSTAQRQALELSTVYDAVLALGSILDTEKVLHRLYQLVSEVIPHDSFGVFLHSQSGDEFYIAMAIEGGEILVDILGTTFAVNEESGFTGYVTRTKRPLFVRDAENEELPVKSVVINDVSTRSWIGVPLLAHNRTVGVLTVQGWAPNMFTRQDLRLLETLAAGVAIALENAQLYEKAQQEILVRKQTESALEKSEAFNQRLVNGAPIGILYLNTDGTIAYGNRKLRDILGMPSAEYFELQMANVRSLTSVQMENIEPLLERVLAGENIESEIVQAQTPWRKNVVLEIYGAPIFSGDNQPDGAVLMIHDLTQHHRAERTRDASFQISEAAYQTRTLTELFRTIHQVISELIGVNNFYIALYDEDHDLLNFPYMVDEKDDVVPHAPGKSITGYVLRSGKTLLATGSELQAMAEAGMVEVMGTMPYDWLGIPLRVGKKYIGVLTVQSYDPAVRLDSRHVQMLEFISTQVAMAIERKQAEENIRQRNRELAILNKLINASSVAIDEQTVLQIGCTELLDAFDMDRTSATILDENSQLARVVARAQRPGVSESPVNVIDLRDKLVRPLLALRAPMVINDVSSDKRIAGIRKFLLPDAKSFVLLPLIIDDVLVGVLSMTAVAQHHFSTLDINFAWSFADQLSTGISRMRLQKSQRMLGAAISQAAEGVMITDNHGQVLYVNPALEQISGISHHQLVGKTALKILRRQVLREQLHGLFESFRKSQGWSGRIQAHKPDGSTFTIDLTTAPVRDEYQTVVNYVGVVHDITAQLQLEAQYRQAQKMDAIGQLTGGIAHDFNNILTAVNGFAELLQRRLTADDPRRRLTNKILDSGQRASALVGKLLTFSRKQIVEMQLLNLNDEVRHIEQLLQPIIGENIRIVTNFEINLWQIKADPTQLEQIIINLAVNARDAMPHGGKLVIETANEVLDTAFTAEHFGVKEGNYVRLSISDTGTGMPDEVREHIFEPFFSTKAEGKGTGLGLATVFGIVKQHGGSIWVYSEVGQGTTFKIYIPASFETLDTSTGSDETLTANLARGTESILVVEDDTDVRELATQILQLQGYTIVTAASGEEALAIVEENKHTFDLVLTDVIMPGINGRELAETLHKGDPTLKIIFMSGYTNDLIATQGILSGETTLISKPFTAELLTRQVRQMLDS